MRRAAFALATATLVATLTACGSTAAEPDRQPPRQPSIAEQQQAVGAPIVDGYTVSVPSIGMRSSLVSLGLNADGTVSVPALDAPQQAGLYAGGPKPGERGPAVVLCHVNSAGQPGCGARFGDLREGDVIDAGTPTGVVRYTVTETLVSPKSEWPTSRIYSNTEGPELRLVTCGGQLDSTGHNYDSNVVVFAVADQR